MLSFELLCTMTGSIASSVKIMDVLDAYGKIIWVDYKRTYGPMSPDRHSIIDAFFASGGSFYYSSNSSTCDCGCNSIKNLSELMSRRPVSHIKDFYDYLFEKNYVDIHSEKFQMEIFNTLCEFCFFDVSDFSEEQSYFEYALMNLILPEYIVKFVRYDKDSKGTLFHKLYYYYVMPRNFMERMFAIFDVAGFDYTTPGCCNSLLDLAVSMKDAYSIGQLLKRGASLTCLHY